MIIRSLRWWLSGKLWLQEFLHLVLVGEDFFKLLLACLVCGDAHWTLIIQQVLILEHLYGPEGLLVLRDGLIEIVGKGALPVTLTE